MQEGIRLAATRPWLRVIAVLSGLLALSALVLLWTQSPSAPSLAATSPAPGPLAARLAIDDLAQPIAAARATVDPAAPTTSHATAPAALPTTLALTELVEVLLPRARAGESAAACRLAYELSSCRGVLSWRAPDEQATIDRWARSDLKGDALQRAIERQRAHEAWNQTRQQQCQALPAELFRQAPRLFLQAGLQGHVPSMAAFANADGIGGAELVADPELYALYRQHAFSFWQRALQAGSIPAARNWQWATQSSGFAFLAGVLPEEYRDPDVARALNAEIERQLALQVERPAPPPPTRPPTPPRALPEAARAQADALFARYFAGSDAWAREVQMQQTLIDSADDPTELTPAEYVEHQRRKTSEWLNQHCEAP